MESRYPCRDHSFILGNRILRSVILVFSFDNLKSIFHNLSPLLLALWLAGLGALAFVQGQIGTAGWGIKMGISSLTTSMAVNALVTGLIIFKILKVFLEVRVNLSTSISVERTFLGSTRGHGNTKLRQVIFVIIESGMTLFAIQLLRLLFYILPMKWTADASDYVIVINVMFNVNYTKICSFLVLLLFLLITFTTRASYQQ